MGWAARLNPTAQAAKRGELKPRLKVRRLSRHEAYAALARQTRELIEAGCVTQGDPADTVPGTAVCESPAPIPESESA